MLYVYLTYYLTEESIKGEKKERERDKGKKMKNNSNNWVKTGKQKYSTGVSYKNAKKGLSVGWLLIYSR